MAITINGKSLTIEKVVKVARGKEKVKLSKNSIKLILDCRRMAEDKIAQKEIVYGINTGIGEFSETVLDDDQIEDFQKYLVYNHSAGIGEPAKKNLLELQ